MPDMLNRAAQGAQQLPQGELGPPGLNQEPGMPQVPMGAPEGAGAAPGNPVTDALKTIMTFVAAQQDQGNPQATQMFQSLQGLVQSMQMQGGQQAPQAPPMEGQPGQPSPLDERRPPQPPGQQIPGEVGGAAGKTARVL